MNKDITKDEKRSSILKVWKWDLHWQILLGILIGIGLGFLSGGILKTGSGDFDFQLYDFIGKLFMKGLKMLIIPLISSSMIVAMSKMGEHHNFARLGGKTLVYYLTTSTIAILIGLVLVNTIKPGVGGITIEELTITTGSQEAGQLSKIIERTQGRNSSDIFNVFSEMVPDNIIGVASSNNHILGVITFSLLFGFFLSKLKGKSRETMDSFFDAFYQIMIQITHFVMKFAPIGIAFMIAKTTASFVSNETFLERLSQMTVFALTVLGALSIHMFIVMPILLKFIAKVNPIKHYKAMTPALLTAFSTASSSATLPLTMECVQNNAKVSKETSGFVLPLGATVNMDGTALYECVSVMFIAQIYGISMGFGEQFLVVALALLTSIGVAGIPSASLVAIVIILNAISARVGVHIGYEAIAIILIFDRILDMCRTATNVFGDSCGAVIIGKTEGENDILA